jgi:hypothetical protein
MIRNALFALLFFAACSSQNELPMAPTDGGSVITSDGGKTAPPEGDGDIAGDDGGTVKNGSALNSRPNDGTGYWPDSSNTGYLKAPDYPGQLTDFPLTSGTYHRIDSTYNGQTIKFKRFRAKVYMAPPLDHVSFYGCLFESNAVNDVMVNDANTTQASYAYSTFKPLDVAAPPVSCAKSYQIGINQSGEQAMTVDHCEFFGFGNAIQFGASSQAKPLVFTNNYFHDAADADDSGGCKYHHDAIGPCSDGGIGYVTIKRNTIASTGNTNGIALQGYKPYDHVIAEGNYISGWGYAVSLGAGDTAENDTNITFTGNVFSGQFTSVYGPLYGNVAPGAGKGNVWRDNRYQVRAGDPWGKPADHGLFWWPTDNAGHTADMNP